MIPGHHQASNRLRAARGSIYAAFDSLGCGFDHVDAVDCMTGSPHFQALPEAERGKVVGLALGFAITAVEADRQTRRLGRWFR